MCMVDGQNTFKKKKADAFTLQWSFSFLSFFLSYLINHCYFVVPS